MKKIKQRKKILVDKLSGYDFDGNITNVIDMLNRIKYSHEGHELTIDFYMEGIPYEDGERAVFEIYYMKEVVEK